MKSGAAELANCGLASAERRAVSALANRGLASDGRGVCARANRGLASAGRGVSCLLCIRQRSGNRRD